MEQSRNLFFNNEFASQYDDLVKKQNWYGSEVLFGMIFEYIKIKDRILDIGRDLIQTNSMLRSSSRCSKLKKIV